MFETLKRLYLAGEIGKEALSRAVSLKWITQEQQEDIVNA